VDYQTLIVETHGAVGLIRLYEATHKTVYLKMAGLSASWFLGNNVLGLPMYDSLTGRCFDGIRDSVTLNKNSGAESTIEALLTFVELAKYPLAMKYLGYQRQAQSSHYGNFHGVNDAVLFVDPKTGELLFLEGDEAREFCKNHP